MPPITRNQKKMNSISGCVCPLLREKPSPALAQACPDLEFGTGATLKMPAEINKYDSICIKYIHKVLDKIENKDKSVSRFDIIRLVTELYYYICESLDILLSINGGLILIIVVYEKSKYFTKQLNCTKVNTAEEYCIVNSFSQQMRESQEKLYPYVMDNRIIKKEQPEMNPVQSEKRQRRVVDYTGMDTVEPLNKYDVITDIWEDTTLYEDPDYEYETDNDDNENEDESENEDFVIERVSKNHIRFVY